MWAETNEASKWIQFGLVTKKLKNGKKKGIFLDKKTLLNAYTIIMVSNLRE